jgi:hypothetical protein
VNTEQKTPVDSAIMNKLIDGSAFYRSNEAKTIMSGASLLDSLEYQVKFFRDIGQIKSSPSLKDAVVTDLL